MRPVPLPISVRVSALHPPQSVQWLLAGPSPWPHVFAHGLPPGVCVMSVHMPAQSVCAGVSGGGMCIKRLRFPLRKLEGFSHGVNIGCLA